MKCRETAQLEALKQQWLVVSGRWGASVGARLQIFNLLVTAYTAANRHYHSLAHIQHMLDLADEMKMEIKSHTAFYFAIWFHDAVQLSGKDSEELSAKLARKELLALAVPKSIVCKVNEFILATRHHEVSEDDDTALFLDIDLSILAASQSQYQVYASACRKEYSIPNFIYRHGRKKFLRSLMRRTSIFNTQLFQVSKERVARENIEWELQGL